jgi:iron complex transport system ATP-binding protein
VILTCENLACAYGSRDVFQDVSLGLASGEMLAILGPNGVGKSTLLKAFAGLHPVQRGRVLLNGMDIARMSRGEVARRVAFAPQVVAPEWPLTVIEYVSLARAPHRGWWRPLTTTDRRIVDVAIARLGMTAFRTRLTPELSGGEWQRVRLAKALAQEPQVLLLDEPTSHLDPRFQLELLETLRDLARVDKLAIGMTLHDLNLVGPWADRVALLAGGKLLTVGTPGEVLTPDNLTTAFGVNLPVGLHPSSGTLSVAMVRGENN